MPDIEQTVSPVTQRFWFSEAWTGARPRFIAILTEIIVSLGLLFGLLAFYWFLRLLILAGVPADAVSLLETVDLWAVKAVFLTFSLAFVIQSALGALSSIGDARRATKARS